MSRHPDIKWAERLDKVYITVLLPDAKNVKVNLESDGLFTFSATAGVEAKLYELKLQLHDKVNVEGSKINTGSRNVFCVVEKAESGWWSKLLRGSGKMPHYVKVDWEKWVDEDDDDNVQADLDLDGMEFTNFGDTGGTYDDFDESDEEEEIDDQEGDSYDADRVDKFKEVSSEAETETASST